MCNRKRGEEGGFFGFCHSGVQSRIGEGSETCDRSRTLGGFKWPKILGFGFDLGGGINRNGTSTGFTSPKLHLFYLLLAKDNYPLSPGRKLKVELRTLGYGNNWANHKFRWSPPFVACLLRTFPSFDPLSVLAGKQERQTGWAATRKKGTKKKLSKGEVTLPWILGRRFPDLD